MMVVKWGRNGEFLACRLFRMQEHKNFKRNEKASSYRKEEEVNELASSAAGRCS